MEYPYLVWGRFAGATAGQPGYSDGPIATNWPGENVDRFRDHMLALPGAIILHPSADLFVPFDRHWVYVRVFAPVPDPGARIGGLRFHAVSLSAEQLADVGFDPRAVEPILARQFDDLRQQLLPDRKLATRPVTADPNSLGARPAITDRLQVLIADQTLPRPTFVLAAPDGWPSSKLMYKFGDIERAIMEPLTVPTLLQSQAQPVAVAAAPQPITVPIAAIPQVMVSQPTSPKLVSRQSVAILRTPARDVSPHMPRPTSRLFLFGGWALSVFFAAICVFLVFGQSAPVPESDEINGWRREAWGLRHPADQHDNHYSLSEFQKDADTLRKDAAELRSQLKQVYLDKDDLTLKLNKSIIDVDKEKQNSNQWKTLYNSEAEKKRNLIDSFKDITVVKLVEGKNTKYTIQVGSRRAQSINEESWKEVAEAILQAKVGR